MVKLVFVATRITSGTHNFITSATKHKWDIIRLGRHDTWDGWRFRMKLYLRYLVTCDTDEIIVLSDADDVLVLRDPTEFESKFKEFGSDIVIGSETHCGGNCIAGAHRSFHNYHDNKYLQSASYANAGSIVGYAKGLQALFRWELESGEQDDQIALHKYMKKHPSCISLDTKASLIAVKTPYDSYSYEDGQLVLRNMNVRPYIIHMPGLPIRQMLYQLFPHFISSSKHKKNIYDMLVIDNTENPVTLHNVYSRVTLIVELLTITLILVVSIILIYCMYKLWRFIA